MLRLESLRQLPHPWRLLLVYMTTRIEVCLLSAVEAVLWGVGGWILAHMLLEATGLGCVAICNLGRAARVKIVIVS